MWSDRLDAASRQTLIENLRRVLPAPRPAARAQTALLEWRRDPAEVAEALRRQPGFAWLDRPNARLFADPLVRIEVCGRRATVAGPGGTVAFEAGGLDLVEAALAAWGGPGNALLCGYLGYELGAELEDVVLPPRRAVDLPELALSLFDWRLEHVQGAWSFHATDAWRSVTFGDVEALAGKACPPRDEGFAAPPVASTPTGEGFRGAVARAVERIRNGELFQVNLCRRLETSIDAANVWAFYRRLRAISPASQGAFLDLGADRAVLSASPELFLSMEDRRVRSCPIKGTRPRGATPEADRELARDLQTSEKDRAELSMIVDVTRNDLGRVCRAGSVAVSRHAELMTLPTVHHTYSEVTGVLRDDCSGADLLRASFPPASITGAPKIRAMQVAAEEEGYLRGPAMGAIGWISMAGDLELSVGIRTAAASGGHLSYLAGCGITAESVPLEELEESEAKAAAFRRALEAAAITTAVRESTRS